MSGQSKQIIWATIIILLAILIHHWLIYCKINCTCPGPNDPSEPILPECVEKIDSEKAAVYIKNFSAWSDTLMQSNIRAYNTSACLDSALLLQIINPKAGQDGLRIYYGLTNDSFSAGDTLAKPFIKFIIIPKNSAGEDLPNFYYSADADDFSWRPCPPYCDR